MKTSKKKHPGRKPSKSRKTLAKRIAAAPSLKERLNLAVYGREMTPEADLILEWLVLDNLSDFRTNKDNRHLLTTPEIDLDTGQITGIRETAEEHHFRWWNETLAKTGNMLAPRIVARDADFFRRFADELATWQEVYDADLKRAHVGLPWHPRDALRAVLLANENRKSLQSDGRVARDSDNAIAKQVARDEFAHDPRLSEQRRAKLEAKRTESHDRNIPRIRRQLHLKSRPPGRPRKADK